MRKLSVLAGTASVIGLTLCMAVSASAGQVVVSPLASTGTGSSPRSIVAGADGSFYTGNYGGHSISGFSGDGTKTFGVALESTDAPRGIAIDSTGALWTANYTSRSITRTDPTTKDERPFPLGGTKLPAAIAIGPSDVVYSADQTGDAVSRVKSDRGSFVITPDYAPLAPNAAPQGIVTDSLGNIYTANTGNGTVSKITPNGDLAPAVIDRFADLGAGAGPRAITIDSAGMLYVANYTDGTVTKINSKAAAGANVVGTFTLPDDARPLGITVDSHDNVYVSDSGPNTVSMIPAGSNSAPITILTLGANAGASGIAVSSTNTLLVTEFAFGEVASLDLNSVVTTTTLSGATVGEAYSGAITSTGVDPVTYSSADLPSWLQLDRTTGALSGTPTAVGDVTFTVIATSPAGASAPQKLTIAVADVNTGGGTTGTSGTGDGGGSGAGGSGSGAGGGSTSTVTHLASTGADLTQLGELGAIAAAVVLGGIAARATATRGTRRHN